MFLGFFEVLKVNVYCGGGAPRPRPNPRCNKNKKILVTSLLIIPLNETTEISNL